MPGDAEERSASIERVWGPSKGHQVLQAGNTTDPHLVCPWGLLCCSSSPLREQSPASSAAAERSLPPSGGLQVCPEPLPAASLCSVLR